MCPAKSQTCLSRSRLSFHEGTTIEMFRREKEIKSKISSFLYYFSFLTFFFILYVRVCLFINHYLFFARYATSPPTEYLEVFSAFLSVVPSFLPHQLTLRLARWVMTMSTQRPDFIPRVKRDRDSTIFQPKYLYSLSMTKTRNKNCQVWNSVYPPAILRN